MDTGDKVDVGNQDRLKSPLRGSRLQLVGFWRPPKGVMGETQGKGP